MCLGKSLDVGLGILGIPNIVMDKEVKRLICIPTENFLLDYKTNLFINGNKWDVYFYQNKIYNKIIALVATETFLNDINSSSDIKYNEKNDHFDQNNEVFDKYINTLWVANIWMIDTFPFHTKELVNNIKKINNLSNLSHIEFGVALLSGLRKYGSTDISTEKEAVEKEKKELSRQGISCIEIDKIIKHNQIIEFFAPKSRQFLVASEKFKSACHDTLVVLEIVDILGEIMLIGVNMSFQEYMIHIKKEMSTWMQIFPVVKYLNESFYQNFADSIISDFRNRSEANINTLSKKFAEIFSSSLKKWIVQICKYNQK